MPTYVPVPADAIRQRLTAAGFQPATNVPGGEEVYERRHERDARYVVRVFSSIARGQVEVRGAGEDAIRVVALLMDDRFHYPPKAVPIFRATRVHRTGSAEAVLDRMMERAREAYGACNEHRKEALAARGASAARRA